MSSSRSKSRRRSRKKSPSSSSSNSSYDSSYDSLPSSLNKYITERIHPNHPRASSHKNNIKRQIHQLRKVRMMNDSVSHNVSKKNRKAAQEAQRQNKNELQHMDFRVREYVIPIIATIRNQLREVQSILYKIEYTNEHVHDWTRRDSKLLERVKQTLLRALHFIVYPNDTYSELYKVSQNTIAFTRSEHNRVIPFFEPVMNTIKDKLLKISHAIYKLAYPKNGKVLKYNKEQIKALERTKQQLLDVSHMIPHQAEIIVI